MITSTMMRSTLSKIPTSAGKPCHPDFSKGKWRQREWYDQISWFFSLFPTQPQYGLQYRHFWSLPFFMSFTGLVSPTICRMSHYSWHKADLLIVSAQKSKFLSHTITPPIKNNFHYSNDSFLSVWCSMLRSILFFRRVSRFKTAIPGFMPPLLGLYQTTRSEAVSQLKKQHS